MVVTSLSDCLSMVKTKQSMQRDCRIIIDMLERAEGTPSIVGAINNHRKADGALTKDIGDMKQAIELINGDPARFTEVIQATARLWSGTIRGCA